MARRFRVTFSKQLATLLLLAALVSSLAIGALPAGGAAPSTSHATSPPPPTAAHVGADAAAPAAVGNESVDGVRGASDAEIDPAVRSSSGEVEVVVRLTEPVASLVGSDEASVETLKRHANATQDDILRFAAAKDGVTIEKRFWLANAVLLRLDTDRVSLETVGSVGGVTKIHRNYRVDSLSAAASAQSAVSPRTAATAPRALATGSGSLATTPNATYGLGMIGAPGTWTDYGVRGENVRVAVLDTGIDADHPDLDLYTTNASDPAYPGGWAEFDSNGNRISGSEPFDDNGHGTHVSGTVVGENASGEYIGVAPDAELMHGSVLGPNGGTFTAVIGGMEWAVENDADVISMSLGPTNGGFVDDIVDPVRNAQSQGVVVIAAIGNDGEGTSGSPGNVYETLGVGAVDRYGSVASFSGGQTVYKHDNWSSPPAEWPGTYVVPDVAAPGVDVKSAVPGGGYDGTYDGTSMATPHVAGASALLLSVNGNLSPTDVKYVLRETAWKPDGEPAGNDTRYGAGVVDVRAAADAATSSDLNGSVVGDADGLGVENASVTVRNASTGEIVANATTDGNGTYRAELPARGTFAITADAGYANATVTRQVGLAEDLTNVTVAVDNRIRVDGTVAEAGTDAPVENATVTVSARRAAETTATAPDGGYGVAIDLRTADVEALNVTAAATGYESATVATSVDDAANATANVSLVGNASISGRVVDEVTGEDVGGANVTAERGNVTYETNADAAGNFTLAGVPGAAEYDLTVSATDYYDANRSISVGDAEDAALGETLIEPETTLGGTVIDAGLDEPLADAAVTVEQNGSVVASATTDENGTYAVALDAGPTNVTVDKDGFHADRTENVSIDPGDDVVRDAALEAQNGSIEDAVVAADTGDALPNATVVVETANGSTFATPAVDENGTYAVADVPRGEYALTTSRADFRTLVENVTVGPGENVSRTVELEPEPATVEGVLRDGEGDPLPNATVTATGNLSLATTATDANGTYALSLPRGEYALTYEKKAYETAEATIELAANETATAPTASIARLPVFFDVVAVDGPGSVDQGDRATVAADVANLGTDNGTRTVVYRFDGERVDAANVTIANGSATTVELGYDVPSGQSPGEYDYAVVGDTVAAGTIAVEESSGGGGGGGGGGGALPPPSTWVETAPADGGGTVIRVRSGYADTPARADFEAAGSAVTVTGATIHYAVDVTRSDVRISPSATTAGEPPAAPVTAVGYVATATEFGNASAVDRIAADLTVDPAALPAGAGVDDVRVYRATGDGWDRVSASERGGTVTATLRPDAEYAVAVDESALGSEDGDGSSEFGEGDGGADDAAVDGEQDDAAAAGNESDAAGENESSARESGDDGSLPGFGPLAALFALLCGAAARRRTGA